MFNFFKPKKPVPQRYIDVKKISDIQDLVNILVDMGILRKNLPVAPTLELKYKHLLKD
jgi:hypothetical protein